jgi:hypothetical protein
MSVFGWSYPPGCNGTPFDDDSPCMVCGKFEDECICPECPKCGSVGDLKCYEEHGLVRTQEQIDSLAAAEESWKENEIEPLE